MPSISLSGRSKRLWLFLVLCLAVGLWFWRGTLAQATALRVYQIPSGSMAPTLKPGDHVFVDTLRDRVPKRGELWLFSTPTGSVFIKRVIGLPGETIEVTGGRVLINGKALSEPYLAGPIAYTMTPISLKAQEYFLLGDARATSNDSHLWGPVPVDQFIGRATYRCWPPSRAGGFALAPLLSDHSE